ncbi:hypothetical protein AWB74_02112 [Caballeronia arvi]|uniref:Uncharacterized protein n=1 Tax=Caballeronia arvi TaxID=1777135 RepID=A0A158HSU8_9BURK|nr:hypothetical protein [Caballeronia arvi]SAL47193.1 hypothetical protein AWB74_02112 [Caballeronia arvi]
MRRTQLGNLFVMHAMVGGMYQAMRATAPFPVKRKGPQTQADRDAIARAEAKRARKAAKLRGI